jgi:hypothetical protein
VGAILEPGVTMPHLPDPTHDRSRRHTDEGQRVPATPGLTPEAIRSRAAAGAGAQLVDRWGRGHALASPTRLGRALEEVHLGILDDSVSRQHAELHLDGASGTWILVDLGSTNGTFVDGRRVERPVALAGRELIVVGHVGFVFVLPEARPALPADAVRLLVGPSGGSLEHGGRVAPLRPDELQLLAALADRRDVGARGGFVTSAEIVAALAARVEFEAPAQVARLARRLVASLAAADLAHLVEHRARAGYRLRLPVEVIALDAAAALAQSRRITLGSPAMVVDEADVESPEAGR